MSSFGAYGIGAPVLGAEAYLLSDRCVLALTEGTHDDAG